MSTAVEQRTEWQGRVEALLQPLPSLRQRNASITRSYIDWYVRCPDLLKWAGLAAFVSRQVGRAVAVQHFLASSASLTTMAKGSDAPLPLKLEETTAQVAPMTAINDFLLRELGWAHAAYLSDAGLAAVEAALADQPDSPLLTAFRQIDAGRVARLHGDAATADQLVWEGNRVLLEYEQRALVQPTAATLAQPLGHMLSLLSWVELDPDDAARSTPGALIALLCEGDDILAGAATVSSFGCYMRTQAPGFLGGAQPDFTNIEHRWYWTENDLWPLWRRIDASTPTLCERMPAMGRLTIL